ncbi:DUF1365 domain-containing protein [Thiomicrorhabdus indica]|uniref:DUF1365 domain-containing protein n=1 Tax=Thiomicrorhabdus indica TaxID=2267253 RepID=UPI001F0FE445|nr:DUF1365 domain-containing protein [Thiomicrorhabdus indica]
MSSNLNEELVSPNIPSEEQGSCFYFGQVMHERFFPMTYKFRYSVMSLKVDVDRIEEEAQSVKGFSVNRFNWLSVHFKDYGARDGSNWRQWLESLLKQYGVQQKPEKIELVCFPRVLGWAFNPLAMWYAYDEKNRLIAVVGEVSNTFGHWHHYVLTNNGRPIEQKTNGKLSAKATKVFHVSPFIGMKCEYRFRLQKPAEHYQIGIYQSEEESPVLVAVQSGKRQPLTTRDLAKAVFQYPFNTLKVVGMIHWWALKIWVKGGKFRSTPKPQLEEPYGNTEMTKC